MAPGMKGALGKAVTVGLVGATGCLSVWQANRFMWKQDMIHHRVELANSPPVRLPVDKPTDRNDILKVTARGHFLNDHFVLVGPRPAIPTKRGVMPEGRSVLSLFVPFMTDDGVLLWVNRGQVPVGEEDDARKHLNNWPAVNTRVVGMIRGETGANKEYGYLPAADRTFPKPDVKGFFQFFERDAPPPLSADLKHLPYYIDLLYHGDLDYSADDLPTYPLSRHQLDYIEHQISPSHHLSYCATWTGAFVYGLYYLRTSRTI